MCSTTRACPTIGYDISCPEIDGRWHPAKVQNGLGFRLHGCMRPLLHYQGEQLLELRHPFSWETWNNYTLHSTPKAVRGDAECRTAPHRPPWPRDTGQVTQAVHFPFLQPGNVALQTIDVSCSTVLHHTRDVPYTDRLPLTVSR